MTTPTCVTTVNPNLCNYAECALEGGQCNFSGTQSVAYGAQDNTGSIYYRHSANGVACNNATFGGDPSQNHPKQCYNYQIPSDIGAGGYNSSGSVIYNPTSPQWTQCAVEGSTCNTGASTPVDILFGANNAYVYTNATTVPCTTGIFGDPQPNIGKACWWRTPPTPTPPTPTPPTPTPPTPTPPTPTPPTPTPTASVPPTPTPWISTETWIMAGLILFFIVLFGIVAIVIYNKNKGTKK